MMPEGTPWGETKKGRQSTFFLMRCAEWLSKVAFALYGVQQSSISAGSHTSSEESETGPFPQSDFHVVRTGDRVVTKSRSERHKVSSQVTPVL